MSDEKPPIKTMITEASDFALRCENKAAGSWIIWLLRRDARLQERLRMLRQAYTAPRRGLDPERLAAILGSYTDAPFDALLDEVRELKAQLELRTEECIDARSKAERHKDARENVADALGRPELNTWAAIVGAVRELVAERDRAAALLGEHLMYNRCAPDAVPVVSVGDVNADGVLVEYDQPDHWEVGSGSFLTIGAWRYRVNGWARCGRGVAVRLTPIDGAPVVPTGEGLTIARTTQRPTWTALMNRLGQALHGEPESEVDDRHLVDDAIAVIERLKDERAKAEQRRIDLAEKLHMGPSGQWATIADAVGIYGLLSSPVARFALAMQERIDAAPPGEPWRHDAWEAIVPALRGDIEWLTGILANPMHSADGVQRDRAGVRRVCGSIAKLSLMLARNEGDLDTFDARAEILAARGIDKQASGDDDRIGAGDF